MPNIQCSIYDIFVNCWTCFFRRRCMRILFDVFILTFWYFHSVKITACKDFAFLTDKTHSLMAVDIKDIVGISLLSFF